MKNKLFLFLSQCLLLLLAGCTRICWWCDDPSLEGKTPLVPAVKWTMSCTPILPKEDYLVKAGPDHPLTVAEMIDIALQINPQTQSTWYAARTAAYEVEVNKSPLWPIVNYQGFVSLTDDTVGAGAASSSGGARIGTGTSVTGGSHPLPSTTPLGVGGSGGETSTSTYTQTVISNISATWLLIDFGGREANIRAARQALLAANWSHNRMIQTVIVDVLRGYYAYLGYRALFEAQKESVADAQTNLEAAETQFQLGLVNRLDVLQAQTSLYSALLQLETYRGEAQTAHGQLANAMGLPANDEFDVMPLPAHLPVENITQSLGELMEMALLDRPDLQSAYATFLQEESLITVASSAGMPTLVANGTIQNILFPHNSILNGHLYNFNLNLNIPIFDGFLSYYQTRVAKSNADVAFEDYLTDASNAYLDVLTSYYAYTTAIETVKYSEEYLKSAQEAYNVALESYKQGTGSILDLLLAQSSLTLARAQMIQARTQYVTSIANIAYSTGTL